MKTCPLQLTAALFLLATLTAPAATLYVDVNGTNATSPFADWTTAATNIQDAVDAAATGDEIVVTNGIYQTGGRTVNGWALANRVAVTKPVAVRSINGPTVTIIQGYQVPVTTNGGGTWEVGHLCRTVWRRQ